MKNFVKGFIVGIGKIIPGVSGAMLAIIMGIYDKAIYYFNNFKNNKRESIRYLCPIGMGVVLAIVIFSKMIDYTLQKYFLMTMLFFVGLIIGGIPFIWKKVDRRDYLFSFVILVVFFGISISNINNSYIIKGNFWDMIVFFISGIFEAIGTVVPGISSTAILMIMGTYDIVIGAIGHMMNISAIIGNLRVILPFTFGIIIGIMIMVKVVNVLFVRCEKKMYSFVLGVLLSSVILLVIQSFRESFSIYELIGGLVLMVMGIFIASLMEEK